MRTRRPVTTYEDDSGYPSVAQALSRRDFIRQALAGATAVGALLAAPSVALSGRKRPSYRVGVALRHPYKFWSCRYEVYQVILTTESKAFASFLTRRSEAKGIDATVTKVLSAHKCKDLQNEKLLKKLHRRLGAALAKHYKKRTKRYVKSPRARLAVRRIARRPPVPGGMRSPSHP